MRPRTFAFTLVAGAFGLLFLTMAANVLLDPQLVFGTPLLSDDDNANYRYHRLRQYQAARERFDGLLFASSRGKAFAPDLLAQKMGAHAVAKFDVTAGMITDHLPALQYVLRDKAGRGERIRQVLLLLDIDTFGKLPATNVNIDSFLPPEQSGEHPAKFWWRYLTVFQLRMWRGIIAHRWRGGVRPGTTAPVIPRVVVAGFSAPVLGIASAAAATASDPGRGKLLVATRPNLAPHVELVRQFASLCRENGIGLAVAAVPLRADARSLYYPEDLENVVERLSRVVPLWDFTALSPVARDIGLWEDSSHFKAEVAAMMLKRIYGGDAQGPGDFGVLRGKSGAGRLGIRSN